MTEHNGDSEVTDGDLMRELDIASGESHPLAVLDDLYHRLLDRADALDEMRMRDRQPPGEEARLFGKAEGLRLAASYVLDRTIMEEGR